MSLKSVIHAKRILTNETSVDHHAAIRLLPSFFAKHAGEMWLDDLSANHPKTNAADLGRRRVQQNMQNGV